jgi:hypothetical protein
MAIDFNRAGAKSVGTAPVAVYTVPTTYNSLTLLSVTAIGLSLCNTSVAPITVSVYITFGAVNYYMANNVPIAPGASLPLFGGKQKSVLKAGDVVNVVASAAGSVDALLSYMVTMADPA